MDENVREAKVECSACFEEYGTADCLGHLADPDSGIWFANIGDDLLRVAERES